MSKLTLPCASYDKDTLDVEHLTMLEVAHVNVKVWDRTEEGGEGDSYSVNLTADDARKLFNWLGVWLHGGNRT